MECQDSDDANVDPTPSRDYGFIAIVALLIVTPFGCC